MSIKSGRQFRSYIISWFLMIVGLIVFIGATSIFDRAESYLLDNFNTNKLEKLQSMAALIDNKAHQRLNQDDFEKSSLYQSIYRAFYQAKDNGADKEKIVSVNFDNKKENLIYGVDSERAPLNSLLVASDLFQVMIMSDKGKLKLKRVDLPGQSLVTHLSNIELREGKKAQLLVNGQSILTILDAEKLTANYKNVKLNRWSKKAQLAMINLPSPVEVSFRYIPRNGFIQPPGSPYYAAPELKRALMVMMENGETNYRSLNVNDNKSEHFHISPLLNDGGVATGAIILRLPSSTYHALSKKLLQSALLIFGLMSVSILLASMFFARKITGPLEQLNNAIARLIHNDFNFKLSPKGFGSFKFLANQFNQMLAHIQKSRGELIQLNKSYHRFVPHGLLKQLGVAGVSEISLGDCCEREMTVLFCDIRGFTTLSESMTPQANFNFINRYLSQIAPVINKRGGIIDKYMGDGIMALFPNGADEATKAAIEMLAALDKYNEKLRQKNLPIVEVGLGLHSGSMMLGTVGTSQRMDATVVSDTVNAAARVESMTKSFATKILITEETKRQLKDLNQYRLRYIASCRIRGKSKPVTLYEVFNNDSVSLQEEKAANQTVMIRAWKAYREGDKATAIALYQRQIEKSPNDKSLFALIERCQSGRL